MSDSTGSDLAEYLRLLEEVFDADYLALVESAEREGRFPRQLIEKLGTAGVFRSKWSSARHIDLPKLVALSERLGGLGSFSVSVGVTLHDSAIAVLRRFGESDYLREIADRAVEGTAIVCLGASEARGGSDLQNAESVAVPTATGYRLRGAKKFVSLSTVADFIILVVRVVSDPDADESGEVALFVVEADKVEIGEPYAKLGAAFLDTAPVEFDLEVPAEAMLARPGTGLAALSWALGSERLSVAAQVVGACDLALGVTVSQLMRRTQFGKTLFEHQALRLRFADLQARLDVLRYALRGLAASRTPLSIRTASGFKVTAVRFGEEVMSECLHVFGGAGYLSGVAPVERWWREMKLGRIGGGADEVLWELVAAGMRPDHVRHDRLVTV
ncbi:acyl-CoA dehydrogenase family protein [Nocardia tengchongensis]|uniref:acyl-CoA dehydrogenase family protein n=1 Tax=Nocardia tengchongensis TaxID=2055889 RepID=UPI003691582F